MAYSKKKKEEDTGYKYEKPARDRDYLYPYLSQRDETVPDTHWPMYELLRNPKNVKIYMGENACQNARRKSYESVLAVFRQFNSPNYPDLWNYNIAAINDSGMNYFTVSQHLAPIAHLIEVFGRETYLPEIRGKRNLISFGINKTLLYEYFQNVEVAEKNGTDVIIPCLPPKPPKSRAEVIFGMDEVTYSRWTKFDIPRSVVYNQFKHWCYLRRFTIHEGLIKAMYFVMRQYPVRGLRDTEYYNIVTDLDRRIFSKHEKGQKERRILDLSKSILTQTEQIIYNYNQDVANASKSEMTLTKYIENALYKLNAKMPLKYSDPKQYDEQQTIERMEKTLEKLKAGDKDAKKEEW